MPAVTSLADMSWPRLPSCRRLGAFRPVHQPLTTRLQRPSRLQCQAAGQPPPKMGGGQQRPGGRSGRGSGSASSSSQNSSKTMFTPVEQQDNHDQPEQQPSRQEQKRAQSPQQRAVAATAAAAGKLLPIAYADGRVTVGDGTLLLDTMSTQVRVNNPAATDMVLLSLAASNGATSMEDFALGAVSAPAVCLLAARRAVLGPWRCSSWQPSAVAAAVVGGPGSWQLRKMGSPRSRSWMLSQVENRL